MAGINLGSMLTAGNAKVAGAAALAVMVALNLTASHGRVVQGVAAFGAALVAVGLTR